MSLKSPFKCNCLKAAEAFLQVVAHFASSSCLLTWLMNGSRFWGLDEKQDRCDFECLVSSALVKVVQWSVEPLFHRNLYGSVPGGKARPSTIRLVHVWHTWSSSNLLLKHPSDGGATDSLTSGCCCRRFCQSCYWRVSASPGSDMQMTAVQYWAYGVSRNFLKKRLWQILGRARFLTIFANQSRWLF